MRRTEWVRVICGREERRGSLSPCGRGRGEFTPLGFAQFDMVAYAHPGLLANRDAQTYQAMNQLFGTCPGQLPRSPISKVSTWPSSTPTVVSSANRPQKPTCSGTSKSRHPACTKWCSPSSAPASSGGPRESRAALNSWSSPRTSRSSVEPQTVKTSVQRNYRGAAITTEGPAGRMRPFSRVLRLEIARQSQPAKFRFPDHEMERPKPRASPLPS